MKLQILGLGESAAQAPPDRSVRWGLPWDGQGLGYDVWFEMHGQTLWEKRGIKYAERLREFDGPIYMQAVHPDIPNSVVYPLEEVVEALGCDYFGSSPAYMLGLAIAQTRGAFSEVSMCGVDCHGKDGYDHQRPNLEYMLGILKGQGVRVNVPESSALLKARSEQVFLGEDVYYPERYGWL